MTRSQPGRQTHAARQTGVKVAHYDRPAGQVADAALADMATRLRAFMQMTRPSVVSLVFFTGVPMLALRDGAWPPMGQAAAILFGIALAAAAASVFNAWIERDLDARMARTRDRPLPSGQLPPNEALAFAWGLTGASLLFMALAGQPLGVLATAATIAFYVGVYTIWLKPRTALNIVIGGAAGAAPPLIVDAALHGSIGLMSLNLFALVFLWTPPHFWAISLFRKEDYRAAGFPMLPLTRGDEVTRRRIIYCALAMLPFAVLPTFTGHLSATYGVVALLSSAWFVWRCVGLWRARTDGAARGVMGASLVYLFVICTAMALDLLV